MPAGCFAVALLMCCCVAVRAASCALFVCRLLVYFAAVAASLVFKFAVVFYVFLSHVVIVISFAMCACCVVCSDVFVRVFLCSRYLCLGL